MTNNVKLIFDAKKQTINYSWSHYCEHPEMKQFLKEIVNEHGMHELIDERTNQRVISGSSSLKRFIE